MIWIAFFVLLFAAYFVSSGIAFIAQYRWPGRVPTRVLQIVYSPLEWLGRRVPPFGRAYNAFHFWCWRVAGRPGTR